jgi:hypothetical protein
MNDPLTLSAAPHRWFRAVCLATLSLGIVAIADNLVTVEWSSAVCGVVGDGPFYHAYGAPFPYWSPSGGYSLHHYFMPQAYVANLLILGSVLFILLKRPVFGLWRRGYLRVYAFSGVVGASLVSLQSILMAYWIGASIMAPTTTIGNQYQPYWELRPVDIGPVFSSSECAPAPFWFGDSSAGE